MDFYNDFEDRTSLLLFIIFGGIILLGCWSFHCSSEASHSRACAYADAHHGRIESYTESTSGGSWTRYRVWLPDGSFVSDEQMEREGFK